MYSQRFQESQIGNGRNYYSTQTGSAQIPIQRKCSLLKLNIIVWNHSPKWYTFSFYKSSNREFGLNSTQQNQLVKWGLSFHNWC
jgi:hypothetical protein